MARNKKTSRKENPLAPGVRLWRNRNFNLFWAGQAFDAFGDSFATIVIPLLVLEVTGSVAQMGLVTGIMGVGSLISGIFSGAMVDRMDRRWLMILCDIGRAIFYVLIPLGWWFMGANMALIYVVSAITGYLSTTFLIAFAAAVPNIVDFDQTTDANGRLQATYALSYIVGPMFAGLTSNWFNPSLTVVIVSCSYLVSALLLFLVRMRQATVVNPENMKTKSVRLEQFLEGIRFLLKHPVLNFATLMLAIFFFFSKATVDLSLFRLKHDLHQNNDAIGLVFGVASFGALSGGLITPMLRRTWGFGLCFLGSLILQGIAIALIGFAPNVVIIAILATVFSLGLSIRNVSSMTMRQQVTPDRLLGRIEAVLWTLTAIFGSIGSALTTAVAEKIGAPLVLISIGIISVFVAIIGFFTPANTRSPENEVTASGTLK